MNGMPALATARLLIRPFELSELEAVYRMFDQEIYPPGSSLEERREWLEWVSRNPRQLALLEQPPYGDRAVALPSGELVGTVGVVPYVSDFAGIPYFDRMKLDGAIAEVGLFWAIAPAHRRQGYAAEAAGALIEWMFTKQRLGRIIATTGTENVASQAVMRRLGMQIERNAQTDPDIFNVLGVLERSAWTGMAVRAVTD